MRTTMTMCAALILAGSGSALAGTKVTFDGRCDGMTITEKGVVAKAKFNRCQGSPPISASATISTKNRQFGETLGFGFSGTDKASYLFDISLPLRTGGGWTLYTVDRGFHLREAGTGTYTVAQ